MISLYWGSFAFGSVLILVSMLFGGADKDFDKDLDLEADLDGEVDLDGEMDLDGEVDLDADMDADGDLDLDGEADLDGDVEMDGEAEGFDKDASGLGDFIWLPIFSMRFWTFGTAAFGFTGVALSYGGLPWLLVLGLATLFGSVMGTAAAYFFRMLKKDSVSGSTTTRAYVGEQARVVLPIEPNGRGKIVLETAAGDVELVATTRDATPIERGSTVIVAGFREGIADVSSLGAERRRQPQRQGQTA